MPDDTDKASFEDELKLRALSYRPSSLGPNTILILDGYPIERGPYAGRELALGIVLPGDYPSTAPNGIHTKKSHEISARVQNPQGSELGNDWIRWSRVTRNWSPGNRSARLFLSQVDSWLELR
jgi:hypothetical protein